MTAGAALLPTVEVVGLGPAGPELTTPQATAVLAAAPLVLLRTARHPAAMPWLEAGARSLDGLYESADSFAELYAAVVDEVVAAATRLGSVAYAVPGSPVVLERSVAALCADRRVEVRLVPGMSFLELAFDRLGVDPLASGVQLLDAEEFAVASAGAAGPFLLGHCWSRHILSEVKLAVEEAPSEPATILHHLGLPDEQVLEVPWSELDRALEPDHLTCLYLPALASPPAGALATLVETVRVLRERCPWDRQQTHQSLVRHLIEEAYEVVEAIEELGPIEQLGPPGEPDAAQTVEAGAGEHLEEELGDLLVQVLFHARLAAEEGMFDLADVASTINEKLVRRHPHVFGDVTLTTAAAVEGSWEQIKKQEKGRTSLMEGIPAGLPALVLAGKLERKLAGVGLGWATTGDDEGLAALLAASGEGDEQALAALVLALARRAAHAGGDPEQLVRHAARALREDFVLVEQEFAGAAGDIATADPVERLDAWRRRAAHRSR